MTSEKETPTTHPKAFGAELRQQRQAVGLNLDDIILETKISRRILEALEAGRFQFLPERVFTRNFVRQYARLIQADEERLLANFEAAWQQFLVASGSHSYQLVSEVPKRVIRWYFWIPILVTVAIFLAIGVIILRGPKRASEVSFEPRRPSHEWATPVISPTSTPERNDTEPTADQDTASKVLALHLRVLEKKECWIRYRDYEGKTGQHLLANGGALDLELAGPVQLTVGNAGAVTLRVGTRELGTLGRPGQVVHTEVTRDGMVQLGAGERSD